MTSSLASPLAPAQLATQRFGAWMQKNYALLEQGHELALPMNLPHPSAVGFTEVELAPFGQLRDWTLELKRGRLVVHELAYGQCIIRLERSTGPLDVLMDAAEAGLGMLALGLVAVGALVVADRA